MRVSVWRGGQLLAHDVDVVSWSITDDATRAVRIQGSVSIVDDTGELIPRSMTSPLSVAGTRLQLTYIDGAGQETPFEWLSVQKVNPPEEWTLRRLPSGETRWVSSGAKIQVDADSITADIDADDFIAPTSPVRGNSYSQEFRRLASPIGVIFDPRVDVSRAVPAATVFEKKRLDALADLAKACGAVLRTRPEGVLEVIPDRMSDPVWDIHAGDDGVLTKISSAQDKTKIFNAVVASSSAGGGKEFVGRSFIMSGPLRWDGPLGRRPFFFSSPLIDSQEAADRAARTRLDSLVTTRVVAMSLEALPHPGLQSGDTVRVKSPAMRSWVKARVVSVSLSGNDAGIEPMSLTVEIPEAALEEVLS